jgi:hypothetical protein
MGDGISLRYSVVRCLSPVITMAQQPDPIRVIAVLQAASREELQWMLLPVQLSTQFELVAGYQTQDREDAGHTARQCH